MDAGSGGSGGSSGGAGGGSGGGSGTGSSCNPVVDPTNGCEFEPANGTPCCWASGPAACVNASQSGCEFECICTANGILCGACGTLDAGQGGSGGSSGGAGGGSGGSGGGGFSDGGSSGSPDSGTSGLDAGSGGSGGSSGGAGGGSGGSGGGGFSDGGSSGSPDGGVSGVDAGSGGSGGSSGGAGGGSGGSSGGHDGGASSGPDAGSGGGGANLMGQDFLYLINNGVTSTQKPDLSSARVEALGPSFAYMGTGSANGLFTIPGVPDEDVLVAVGGSGENGFFVQVAPGQSLDLSQYAVGRSNIAAAPTGTDLTLQASGMTAWQAGDDIELCSPGAGLFFGDLVDFSEPTPNVGDTALNVTFDYGGVAQGLEAGAVGRQTVGLIDSTQGDSLFVTHLVSQPVNGDLTALTVVKESYALTNLQMVASSTTNLAAGVFSTRGTSASISFNYPSAAFAQVRAAANPSAALVAGSDVAFVDSLAQGSSTGGFLGGPDLLLASFSSSSTDVSVSTSYVNPFPSNWPLIIGARENLSVAYSPTQGGPDTETVTAGIDVEIPFDGTDVPSLAPPITPVSAVTLNGAAFSSNQLGVGLTPTLAWTAPTGSGSVDAYSITLMQFAFASGASGTPAVASIFNLPGTATSLQIPSGILQHGTAYMVIISATSSPGYSVLAPNNGPLKWFQVPYLSAMFVP